MVIQTLSLFLSSIVQEFLGGLHPYYSYTKVWIIEMYYVVQHFAI